MTVRPLRRNSATVSGIIGPGKVVLGSDYPYVLGDLDPVATVRNAEGISAADKEIILERSAADLLGL